MQRLVFLMLLSLFSFTIHSDNPFVVTFNKEESEKLIQKGEIHFKSMKQLTFGGENAEAYFDPTFRKVIFQSRRDSAPYDAIYEIDLNGEHLKKLSSGIGVTTCSYFLKDGKSFIYASTHHGQRELIKPDKSMGYVWMLYEDFDIFQAEYPSGKIIKQLTVSDRYDAEATVSPRGDKILFTSLRDGDMEIYVMNSDGSNQTRLTNMPGFDGGPFFSWNGDYIVWRGSHPENPDELKKQMELQDKNMMTPVNLDIYIMKADGSEVKRLTNNKSANFGPFFHPSDKRIIFSSNYGSARGFGFDLWMIDIDGNNLERITYDQSFNGFPMFTQDAKYLIFGSNRANAKGSRDTNLFIAEWQD